MYGSSVKNRKHKKLRKIKKFKKRTVKHKHKHKGGMAIDSGGYGCIFYPSLPCNNTTTKGTITKLMRKKYANDEYKKIQTIYNLLKNIPNFSKYFLINDINYCSYNTPFNQKDLQGFEKRCTMLTKKNITKSNINSKLHEIAGINMPNGGKELKTYINDIGFNGNLKYLNSMMLDLLTNGIIPMNKAGVYHGDIKDSNILFDNKYMRLIDWGLSIIAISNNNGNGFITPMSSILDDVGDGFQYNNPFTSIIFSDHFKKLVNKLKSNKSYNNTLKEVKGYVIDLATKHMEKSGSIGHLSIINEITNKLDTDFISKSGNTNKHSTLQYGIENMGYGPMKGGGALTDKEFYDEDVENVIDENDLNENTLHLIADYITQVLEYYNYDVIAYLPVYLKNIDIWGFVSMFDFYLDDSNTSKKYTVTQSLFVDILFENPYDPIDVAKIITKINAM